MSPVTLDDKYTKDSGRAFLTGTQTLVRVLLSQRRADRAAGISSAGYVSGYRGSPLGGFDQELWRARPFLDADDIRFQPGLNEDLAATAVWGSQQVGLFPGARHQGVFGMWYAKGPGVDRSGDALKHANSAGTSRYGGVVAVAGDDHVAQSSSLAHQSEYAFIDASIPVLAPSNLQEVLDYGLYGYALSRYSGLWAGLKVTAKVIETSGTIELATPWSSQTPDLVMPIGGLHVRWPDGPVAQEQRLVEFKLPAAAAFIRANPVDRIVSECPEARLGIAVVGKSYGDLLQALELLELDDRRLRSLGIRVYKIGLVWPLDEAGLRVFSAGLDQIFVVEEKRDLVEQQIRSILYSTMGAPAIIGKRDANGVSLLPASLDHSALTLALALGRVLLGRSEDPGISARLTAIQSGRSTVATDTIARTPYFCSGCPHNSSTKVPEGSLALGGIGCHSMAMQMDRANVTYTQMGGEGATWIGQALFTDRTHVFQNLGDGTYFHSGSLAIRAALAAGVNVTFKILYNDAVAMTGGQPVDGELTVHRLVEQVAAEGVTRIAVVADDPSRYDENKLPRGATLDHRDRLDRVSIELRETSGVSVLIYDQVCAAEKRRRAKRAPLKATHKRVLINKAVCEGCGDCGIISNCLSVTPVETMHGRKRTIDQSSCNTDFSCLKGFCPSFITVESRAEPRSPTSEFGHEVFDLDPALPAPRFEETSGPYRIQIVGVGGTGVVTLGALIGMAAHMEGRTAAVHDMTGMAQKGGAVVSHVTLLPDASPVASALIPQGQCDLLIGCDLVVASSQTALQLMKSNGRAVINRNALPTGEQIRSATIGMPTRALVDRIENVFAGGAASLLDATSLSKQLLNDSVSANILLLGHAWQQGLIPLALDSLMRAIDLNGVAVKKNRRAFNAGCALAAGFAQIGPAEVIASADDTSLDDASFERIVEHRINHLTDYQDRALAERYRRLVERTQSVELGVGGDGRLARAVAISYSKLLAYKDEYEVARLHTQGPEADLVARARASGAKVRVHLSPPVFARRDPLTGIPRKYAFSPWILGMMAVLARLKMLRGSPLDPFGRHAERRMERALIIKYEQTVDALLKALHPDNVELATDIASLPQLIRGFGHIKARNVEDAARREAVLLLRLMDGHPGGERS